MPIKVAAHRRLMFAVSDHNSNYQVLRISLLYAGKQAVLL